MLFADDSTRLPFATFAEVNDPKFSEEPGGALDVSMVTESPPVSGFHVKMPNSTKPVAGGSMPIMTLPLGRNATTVGSARLDRLKSTRHQ